MRRVTLALLLALALLVGLVGSAGAAEKPITVIVDGKTLSFDVTPYQTKGTTMVPMRAIFEALGATVEWDEKTQSVAAVKGDTTIVLTIGKAEAKVKGKAVALAVPAVKSKGKTMVPLRFVSEALGAEVNWDGATRTITIVSAKQSNAPAGSSSGAVDQEALKLLQGTYSTEPQDVDFSGKFTVSAGMSGLPLANFDAEMKGSVRKNYDQYTTIRAKALIMGAPPQDLELVVAVKDNVLYSKDPTNGQWFDLGPFSPTDLNLTNLDLNELGLGGFNPTEFAKMLTDGGLFKEVRIVGDETLDGKTYKKILAVFSPDFFNDMIKKLMDSQLPAGTDIGADFKVNFDKFEMTVLVDPLTGFQRRTDLELTMSMTTTDPASGMKIQISAKMSGQFDLVQNSALIQFPDLSGAVKSELPRAIPAMPGMGK